MTNPNEDAITKLKDGLTSAVDFALEDGLSKDEAIRWLNYTVEDINDGAFD